ncbi:MAG: tRNA (N6-isopentenyl adenosine(37)-C2)-methylthiotransferase MiaB [Candidatus Delongbacteria bacterium]|nr:tRNA (N6-isopentenyl adenosine(37)-C2)-methylthiotransferase MiaB [Candidatus Delongbacteria bacterium]
MPVLNKPRVYLETYGCQMNFADSELVAAILEENLAEMTSDIAKADVILVNTCAIREHASQRVMQQLHRYQQQKLQRPEVVIGVLGCMSSHLKEEISQERPWVDLVVGPDSYRQLPQLITARRAELPTSVVTGLDRYETYEQIFPRRDAGVNAWVTITRGCDNFCSYCVVPFARGRERSRPLSAIQAEMEQVVREGFREVTLLGQNVNSWREGDNRFPELLEAVTQVAGIERIRFISPHPRDFSQRLLEVIRDIPQVMNHIHLPLQSGSDPVLERMNRGYTASGFIELAQRARATVSELAISTDIIVGFCGESEADFEATLALVREVEFDSAFTFKYSERSGTIAAREYEDDVPAVIKGARLDQLMELQNGITRRRNSACIGREFAVMAEGPSRKLATEWMGRTGCNRIVVFPFQAGLLPGRVLPVRIEELSGFTLRGNVTQK